MFKYTTIERITFLGFILNKQQQTSTGMTELKLLWSDYGYRGNVIKHEDVFFNPKKKEEKEEVKKEAHLYNLQG